MSLKLYLQPLRPGTGYETFSDEDGLQRAIRKLKKKGLEEYEIGFIDGESIDAELFKAISSHESMAAHIERYMEIVDSFDDNQKVAAILMIENGDDVGESLDNAENEDFNFFEGDPEDYAKSITKSLGGASELDENALEAYFDYASYGESIRSSLEDMASDGDNTDEDLAHLESRSDEDLARDFLDAMAGGLANAVKNGLVQNVDDFLDYEQMGSDWVSQSNDIEGTVDGTNYILSVD